MSPARPGALDIRAADILTEFNPKIPRKLTDLIFVQRAFIIMFTPS
jgi:hypothetical protein